LGTCAFCKREVVLPFKCNYCGQTFCDEHRLPENHLCPGRYNERKQWFHKTGVRETRTKTIINKPHFKRNRFSSYSIVKRLREITSYLFSLCYVLFFSLPVGVAIMVSMANLDPFTRVLLQNMITQINLFALGYVICACYLFYQKVTRRDTLKAYSIVAVLSIVSTWILIDKIAVLRALNYLFSGQPETVPNILDIYQLWVYVLLDTGLSLIKPLFQNYVPVRSIIINMRRWISERVRQVI